MKKLVLTLLRLKAMREKNTKHSQLVHDQQITIPYNWLPTIVFLHVLGNPCMPAHAFLNFQKIDYIHLALRNKAQPFFPLNSFYYREIC